MYTRTAVDEALINGESSYAEFKEDTLRPDALAKELVAFANFQGGSVFLGVSDDGRVSGLSRFTDPRELEEWVMNIARTLVRPPLIPSYQLIRGFDDRRDIAIVSVSRGADVYALAHGENLRYYIRVGTTSREASTEELQRLFQRRGKIRAELIPFGAASYDSLDHRRLGEYFVDLRGQEYPDDRSAAMRQLILAEFMTHDDVVGDCATIAGVVIFGEAPHRFAPGLSVDAAAFDGSHASVETLVAREEITGPLVRLGAVPTRPIRADGIVETAMAFVKRFTSRWTGVTGAVRDAEVGLPDSAVREAIVNALVHRDYTLSARSVQLRIYTDRLAVMSPGRLPNGISPASMEIGTRSARNQLIIDTMRDYGYVERLGLGVPQMIRTMEAFNGSRPIIEEHEETLVVTLLR